MKRVMIITLLLVCSLSVVWYGVNASDRAFFMPAELAGVKVLLDAGHGGEDGGASTDELIESDVNLAITKEVEKKLKQKGATVVMTRTKSGDAIAEHAPDKEFSSMRERKFEDLKMRVQIAETEEPDLFLSVHVNAIPEKQWRGAQVFYHPEGHEGGEALAKSIQGSFKERLKNTDREAMKIKGVYLLKNIQVPSVIVETGFISNPEEHKLLADPAYRKKVADAIVAGVVANQLMEQK
ncbi:N-acetylmuramoyl-L-alanine amidase [Sporosarcina sp. BI001-red]|uniref:N-acetylmuramoyl-L-alanine amidase n=1 Tax=Sporosarcina sp. BI001-red TaxID=2282866 RepID=UPI000E287138|nr:N-acetylmuramoyl-L-alanine amidase [Sporosarcina sp. BI001-red]REB07885.1 N-acetylmuramoyl-L-alanine amidase [Sporosarcina sp. BI001-red]